MFDIGISEIMVIAVVALVVIGPERLPRVARTIGTLLGRAQRYVNDVKAEVNREMELDELKKLQSQMQSAAQEIHQSVANAGAEVQTAVQDAEKSLNESIATAKEVIVTQPSDPGLVEMAPLAEPPGTPALAGDTVADASSAASSAPAEGKAPEPANEAPAQAALFPEHTVR